MIKLNDLKFDLNEMQNNLTGTLLKIKQLVQSSVVDGPNEQSPVNLFRQLSQPQQPPQPPVQQYQQP